MKLLLGLCALCVVVLAKRLSTRDVEDAIERARELNERNREFNRNAAKMEGFARKCPLANFHGRRPSDRVTVDNTANDLLTARRLLQEDGFTEADLQDPAIVKAYQNATGPECETGLKCGTGGQYRTADGTCNNLQSPKQGSAGAAQIRLMAPVYDDGFSSPRARSVVPGQLLPSAREVSNAVHRAGRRVVKSKKINLHVFQMGQFIDHDIIATPVQGEVEDCCSAIGDVDNCFPIIIDWEDDPNPNFVNGYCMNFARSAPHVCPVTSTTILRREQINVLTSFIDASNVYGSSEKEQHLLRENGTGGFMKVADSGNRLPDSDDSDACISNVENGIFCSLAGDHRVNVVPSLTAYHNLFVFEHNRIASQLSTIYSDPEELFQETRRIVIAIMQKVVYDEFLPSFLSPETMNKFELSSNARYRYAATIDPTVSNAFGIAYRMGHTWIPRTMELFNSDLQRFRRRRTEATYFVPDLTYFNGQTPGMDGLALWLTGNNLTATDRIIENAARNDLFLDDEGNSFDLASLNIQRGRDHGLPSYTAFRKFCELDAKEVQDFGDLQDIERNGIRRLSKVYEDPRDIDLFTGALAETSEDSDSLGPTLSCILGDQFGRLKFGDRFWYQGDAANFNRDQIKAIKKYSMAKLLCNNYVFKTVNAPNAFLATDSFRACAEIDQLNLEPFGVTAPPPTTPETTPRPSRSTRPSKSTRPSRSPLTSNNPRPYGGPRPSNSPRPYGSPRPSNRPRPSGRLRPRPPKGAPSGARPPFPGRGSSKRIKHSQSHLDELFEDLIERLEKDV